MRSGVKETRGNKEERRDEKGRKSEKRTPRSDYQNKTPRSD